MIGSNGSTADPYLALNWSSNHSHIPMRLPYWYTLPTGYAARSPRVVPAQRTAAFVVLGQSNAAAYGVGAAHVPVNSAVVDSLSIFNGGIYEGKDPGPNMDGPGISWLYRFADLLITAGHYDRVIMVPAAMGSARCADYAPGGVLQRFPAVAHRRLAAIGLPVTAYLWQQGESDGGGTVSAAQYQAMLQAIIDGSRLAGSAAPWLIGKSTYSLGVTSAEVRAGCAAVVNGTDVFNGADTDTLTAAYRAADNVHFSATGCASAASLWRAAVVAALGL